MIQTGNPACVTALGGYPDQVSTWIRLTSIYFLFALLFPFLFKRKKGQHESIVFGSHE
jgi:hypothetical protein